MFFDLNVRIALSLSLLLLCLLAGCRRTAPQPEAAPANSPAAVAAPTSPPQILSSTLTGLVATMENETRDVAGGQIAWTTYWKLCWNAYPDAQGYEVETRTGEGASRKLRRQTETCLRVEVAKGQNEKAKGFFNRELMLASISGQVAYRVRAVLDGNRATQWSPLMEAGKADQTPAPPPPKKRPADNAR